MTQAAYKTPLGVVEGFYGHPWSDASRLDLLPKLADFGHDLYLYAPKSDAQLRKQWRRTPPDAWFVKLQQLRDACRRAGLRFGVGLSPLGYDDAKGAKEEACWHQSLQALASLKIDCLHLLFDDMAGDPAMLRRQCHLTEIALQYFRPDQLALCPSYYCFDPILEELFGPKPKQYWRDLGRELPAELDLVWTGESVINEEIRAADCERIAQEFDRYPLLWDNYPVNDGRKTHEFLHLAPLSGRPPELQQVTRGHLLNPMVQAHCSLPALLSLSAVYNRLNWDEGDGFEAAGFSEALQKLLLRDWRLFQYSGLSKLTPEQRESMKKAYRSLDEAASQEVADWLDGAYRFDPDCLND